MACTHFHIRRCSWHTFFWLVVLSIISTSGLVGCGTINLGGSHETVQTVFVEPGGDCDIATDRKIKVRVKDSTGKEWFEERNLGGMHCEPQSVHKKLAEFWEAGHK